MKILVQYSDDGHRISNVSTLSRFKQTEEKIIARVNEVNENEGKEIYKIFDIADDISEIILFFLGDRAYKRYADMDDLEESVADLSASINSIYDDVFDMREAMDHIERMFKEFKKSEED